MPGILPYHRVFQLSLEILRKIKVESEQMYNEEMDSQWTLRHFEKKSGPSNRVSQGIINLRCLVMCSLLGKHVSWCIYRQLEYCMFLSSVKKKKPTFMWWVHSRLSLSLYLRVHTFHAQHKLWLLRNINSYAWVREFFFFVFLGNCCSCMYLFYRPLDVFLCELSFNPSSEITQSSRTIIKRTYSLGIYEWVKP